MNSNQLRSLGTDSALGTDSPCPTQRKSKRGEPAVKERPLELAVQQVEHRRGA